MAKNHGTAGRSAREMANRRYMKATIIAGVLFLIAVVWFYNLNNIIKLGLPAIAVLAVIMILAADRLEKKGLFIKKRARDADRGARAEEVVAERLASLPEGYHAFHDLAFEGFNIDHVIVGPGGIFLVETKSHREEVTARGDILLLNGKQPTKNFLNQAWSQTYQLRDLLKTHTSREWKIKPVLCFTRAFVKVRGPVKGVEVLNKKYLAAYLSGQPQILGTEEIETVTRIMRSRVSGQHDHV